MKTYEDCTTILEVLTSKSTRITMNQEEEQKCLLLNRADCYFVHKLIKERLEGATDALTWDTGLAFNCEFYSHEDLYDNLFKLRFFGVQLGQEG